MKSFWHSWLHEYRRIMADAGALLIFFGAMVIYPIVYPVPYSKEVLKEVPIAVVDLDHSQLSRRLIRMLDAQELLLVAARPAGLEEARDLFYRGRIEGIVVIAEDFTRKILKGDQATVTAYCDASYFLLYRQVLTGVLHATGTISAGIEIRRAMAEGVPAMGAYAERDPLPLLSLPLFNPGSGYATYAVPPVMLLILQQTLLIGIGMMQGTRREQKSAAAVPTPHQHNGEAVGQLLGRSMAYLSIYIFHAVYITVILFRFYRFPQQGRISDVLLFLLPFLLSIIFLGLAISVFFRERETSMVVLLCTSIPAVFLAGFSWPAEAIPHWLRLVSFLIPSTAGIDGFLKINAMGATLREVARQWWILWGLALVYFWGALWAVRRAAGR